MKALKSTSKDFSQDFSQKTRNKLTGANSEGKLSEINTSSGDDRKYMRIAGAPKSLTVLELLKNNKQK
jgi:hypothetical protein